MQPIVEEISYQDPNSYFRLIASEPDAIFLDSADYSLDPRNTNRYSYIAYGCFDTFKINDFILGNPFDRLKEKLKPFYLEPMVGLPPFQGGVAGYFSYDLCHYLEKINQKENKLNFPYLELNFYDVVIAFDHVVKKAWIIASGFPEINLELRLKRAKERLKEVRKKILSVDAVKNSNPNFLFKEIIFKKEAIQANFTQEEYCRAVEDVIEYIKAGDIFEANLSQRFQANLPKDINPYDLYCKLRQYNPAPFSAYLNFGEIMIASASPERFIKLYKNKVETRPIKGTRPRSAVLEEDQFNAKDLLNSVKDRAENIMIVDLMRNDLSRICKEDSVLVTQLCGLESFRAVHHLVSVIEAELKDKVGPTDLLYATFPGGSITGAPKVRAMQIIAELERNNRGPYCGSIGYIGFDGCMDTSIVIRTYLIKENIISYQAGGAIVYDSDPFNEYQETLHKARALTTVLTEKLI